MGDYAIFYLDGDTVVPTINAQGPWDSGVQHGGAVAGVLMVASFFVVGGAAAGGWTSYTPLTGAAVYTGVNWGINLWVLSLFVLAFSSLMGSINYITTIINMRAPACPRSRLAAVTR